jgi:hypothetical protein
VLRSSSERINPRSIYRKKPGMRLAFGTLGLWLGMKREPWFTSQWGVGGNSSQKAFSLEEL